MRRYESVVILDPEMPDDEIRNFSEKYSSLIKTSGGEIIKIEDWGFKRLAYKVKKRDRGRYILIDFVGLPALINELERQFKISEDVMKFLSVKVDEEVDLEAFKAAAQKKEAVQEDPVEILDAADAVTPLVASSDETDSETIPVETVPGNLEALSPEMAETSQLGTQNDNLTTESGDIGPSSALDAEKEGR